ncbi:MULTISPECIES: hypothetical protein [unclassified Leptolyngbya]|jgi:hypothetical protein|uniref:hypothetical protein n=1 Tax=unclassified Leptolyngbya TaxID=2650499 RepID=UPI0016829452|nr:MULTISPECIES: hypothetical protein [unclassified Leptolyngbya]MBD1909308.1 hypothetical protein [Leptolyngbya sp. FACHB-8]MBD2153538.1 hypothetical protein [Leptolyngbya sp. FACHB-16]
MQLTANEAGQQALAFLLDAWSLSLEYQEWFTIRSARPLGEDWYVVEIGFEGLPDEWIIQVYDSGECEPSYTFRSPILPSNGYTDLDSIPENLADVLIAERNAR